jgi:hypothetical protein
VQIGGLNPKEQEKESIMNTDKHTAAAESAGSDVKEV